MGSRTRRKAKLQELEVKRKREEFWLQVLYWVIVFIVFGTILIRTSVKD